MEALYFFVLPIINAFNFSRTLIIPLVASIAASLWMILSSRKVRTPFIGLDWLFTLVILSAAISTTINVLQLNPKSLNHLAALVASIVFFYYAVDRFSQKIEISTILRALWVGYVVCAGFGIFEFALINFFGFNIGNLIPRPAVEDYEPTFLGLPLIRARSTFEESGHFAAYLSICIPFLIHYHWVVKPSRFGKYLFVTLTAGAMLVAFSVSAFIFLPLSLLAIGAIHIAQTRKINRSHAVTLGLMTLGTLILISSEGLFNDIFLRKFEGASFIDRNEKFLATLDLMSQSSWTNSIFGHGPGSYDILGIEPAISVYLNFYRDFGLLGLLTLICTLIYATTSVSRVNNPMGRATLWGIILTILYFAAIPNYFHPHYYIPFIFYKRIFLSQEKSKCRPKKVTAQ